MFYNFDNDAFNFHGRWETVEGGKKSHWTRPYFEFFCDADLKFCLADGAGEYSVWVNGEVVESENGVYKLNEESLVRFTADETAHTVTFKGIETDGNVRFAPSRDKHMLIIGDSLTHSAVSHSVLLPKWWDCDYTCVAQGGIALCVDRGYVKVREELKDYRGMSVAFFYLTSPCEGAVPMIPFDFEGDCKYDAVILNIGTNDHLTDESWVKGFAETYAEFVARLHQLYPNVPTYLLLPSADTVDGSGWRRNTIEKCAKEAEAKYSNMTYISSREWDVEISSDNVHPTEAGYKTYAEELKKAIGKI